MSGIEQLLKLRDQLNAAIDTLVASPEGKSLPALDDSLSHAPPALMTAPGAATATAVAQKITALLAGPHRGFALSLSGHVPACLVVAINAHAAEAIRDRESEPGAGLPVSEIAKASTIAPAKLARVLRLLAANYIFVEKKPGVFANNRCSIGLDTGKSAKELQRSPADVYEGTDGHVALMAHCAEDGLKATAFLTDALFDQEAAHSYKPEHAPVSHAYDRPIFDFFAAPGNEAYLKRFGMAMYAINSIMQGEATLATGYPFQDLAPGAKVVDVGGGVGSVSLTLRQLAPHLCFVVQDRPEVIEQQAPKVCCAGKMGREEVKDAALFLLRLVIHDWADEEALAILKPLAEAATSETRLLLVEQAYEPLDPDPLVHNSMPYLVDLEMMAVLNAQERTQEQYVELAKRAGWTHVKTWIPKVGDAPSGWRHYEFQKT
ncbi:hypothetical protein C6P46_005109 [Rhodotorula mucilaginosa]|uniref:O-methyltransferase C-terminal domain-containing protein n=1 Tax=Rhodotorula mucilaginosa TaxID=5537 RepID=A0A9P7B4Y1_RHOMI|nr:hypothetical protein C6P46_005109 [Rhodotorula mucilaginosa]